MIDLIYKNLIYKNHIIKIFLIHIRILTHSFLIFVFTYEYNIKCIIKYKLLNNSYRIPIIIP